MDSDGFDPDMFKRDPSQLFEWSLNPDTLLEDMEKVPLFMTNTPTAEDIEENPTLLALQTLMTDGVPEDNALEYKDEANEEYKKKNYKKAQILYTKGLEQECDNEDLNNTIRLNRAACNLILKNYGMVVSDCSKVLKAGKNIKAFYRAAQALYHLDRLDLATGNIDLALEMEQRNEFKVLKEKIKIRSLLLQKLFAEKKVIDDKVSSGLIEMSTDPLPIRINIDRSLTVKPTLIDGILQWPVVFLYPKYHESDFIAEFPEDVTIYQQLEVMFESPAPFDIEGEFIKIDEIEVYFLKKEKYVKVDVHQTLGEILVDGFKILSNVVLFYVVRNKQHLF